MNSIMPEGTDKQDHLADLLGELENFLRAGIGSYVGHPDKWTVQERRDAEWRMRLRVIMSQFEERPGGDA